MKSKKELERIEGKEIVYIIGAGTSKGDGIPLLNGIQDALIRLINYCIYYPRIKREKLENVYNCWKNNFPDKNIEYVMTRLSEENKQELLHDFEYSYVAVIIYYAYYYNYYQNSKKESKHSSTYIKFINRVLSEKAGIITLNVDNQICDCVYGDTKLNDAIFNEFPLKIKEDLKKGNKEVKREVVSSLTDSWPFKFKRVHGSISYPNHKRGSGHQITISLISHFEDLENGNFRIEYPRDNKEYKYFPEFWEGLELIKNAKKIIFIGYSFPKSDIYWGLEFSKAISQNINNPDIEIVNPSVRNIGWLINNYLQVIPPKFRNKVRFYQITFEAFLKQN